jgi:hypothetical protein
MNQGTAASGEWRRCYSPGGVLLLRPDPDPPVECRLWRRLPPRDEPPRDESPDEEKRRFSAKPSRRCKKGFFKLRGEVGDADPALASVVCCEKNMHESSAG